MNPEAEAEAEAVPLRWTYDNDMDQSIERYLKTMPEDTTHLDLSYFGLKRLPDISRFTKLELLDCSNNYITMLPSLSENTNLEILVCRYNLITEIHSLNFKLERLDCRYNSLVTLPSKWPPLLEFVSCSNNRLQSIPAFGKSIVFMDCSNNAISRLPVLNEKLEILFCQNNLLTELPLFGPNVDVLDCSNNPLCFYYPSQDISVINVIQKFRRCFYIGKFCAVVRKRWFYYMIKKRLSSHKRELLEMSGRIALNPKRIRRLLESGEITLELDDQPFYDM